MKEPVKCKACGWIGDVSELTLYEEDGEDIFHCPICGEEI